MYIYDHGPRLYNAQCIRWDNLQYTLTFTSTVALPPQRHRVYIYSLEASPVKTKVNNNIIEYSCICLHLYILTLRSKIIS